MSLKIRPRPYVIGVFVIAAIALIVIPNVLYWTDTVVYVVREPISKSLKFWVALSDTILILGSLAGGAYVMIENPTWEIKTKTKLPKAKVVSDDDL